MGKKKEGVLLQQQKNLGNWYIIKVYVLNCLK